MTGDALRQALRLVVILDHDAALGRDLARLAAACERGGATMLQLRAKQLRPSELADTVRRVREAARHTAVLVNDRLDVALATNAAGCHLGQDDFPPDVARAVAPPGFVIGSSAGSSAELERALRQGCDYLGIGPFRGTTNKADAGAAIGAAGFGALCRAATVPCVAIGGVRASDVAGVCREGAAGVAVIGAVLAAPDPEAATRELRTAVDACLS